MLDSGNCKRVVDSKHAAFHKGSLKRVAKHLKGEIMWDGISGSGLVDFNLVVVP